MVTFPWWFWIFPGGILVICGALTILNFVANLRGHLRRRRYAGRTPLR